MMGAHGPPGLFVYTPKPKYNLMGITRAAIIGTFTWAMMALADVHHNFALVAGVITAFFAESIFQSNTRSILKHKATGLQTELNLAIVQLNDMKRALDKTTHELRNALGELHRRDAIGSPAARELLARQEEALDAQSAALEVSSSRSIETLESLERMVVAQGSQTARMQEVLTQVLQKLALAPRQNIHMRDSVLMQEQDSIPTMNDDVMAMLS
jgi:uncharacterized coiled-coil protein SlyX